MILSRYQLAAFLACRRRFQLRYLQQMPWPVLPQINGRQKAQQRGNQFHFMLQRYFLELPFAEAQLEGDDKLAVWWRTFQRQAPQLPAGTVLTEYALTVPIRQQFLTGRFDLLVVNGAQVHIFDWKTEARPRTAAVLQDDLQTLLYFAMVTEGWHAFSPLATPIDPDQVRLTYWFVADPTASVTLSYSRQAHQTNWGWLMEVVGQLENWLAKPETVWALTDNWSECERCAYQIFCKRRTVAQLEVEEEAEEGAVVPAVVLEPELF